MKLRYTRAMITAALAGRLNNVGYIRNAVFGFMVPKSCPDVPDALLDPRSTWTDKEAYDKQANELAKMFTKNFEKYAGCVNKEIFFAAPLVV
jgi:phosphoenolpyruvate carboxykinase (ATP)